MRRPNILLVILDATRADACSCYGAEQPITPNLDRLASEGVLFEQAISPAPWTLPALASLFTGLYPGQTQVYSERALPPVFPTIAQVLAEDGGYATFAISNCVWFGASFGLQRGFSTVHKLWQVLQTDQDITAFTLLGSASEDPPLRNLTRRMLQGNVAKNVVNTIPHLAGYLAQERRSSARRFLDAPLRLAYDILESLKADQGARRTLAPLTRWIERQQAPWFAAVHYLEAHLPYRPPTAWARHFAHDWPRCQALRRADQVRLMWRHIAGVEQLGEADLAAWKDLYLAGVAYQDSHLGLLVDWLRRTQRLDGTLVVVVADHGENLGEHGLLNHQYCLYDTLLRVPLVVRFPGALPVGQRFAHQVQTLDIFPTILGLAGLDPPSPGKSLFSAPDRRRFTVAEYGRPSPPRAASLARFGLQRSDLGRYERGLTAIRTDGHKLILGSNGSPELYAWCQDPAEEHNLAEREPSLVTALQTQLGGWWSEKGIPGLIDGPIEPPGLRPEVESRLRRLGYLE
jgi:arylsulfatase A-like enzyme